ncbi:MAG: hypothetical protein V7711_11040 [Pseudomonadales bacterium]
MITLLLLSHPVSAACDCQWQGPFSWLVDESDTIIHGEVVSHKGNSFDIWVETVLKGKEFQEVVRLWGTMGDDCRAEVKDFPFATHWVFALRKIKHIPDGGFNPSTPNISFGRVGDYELLRCGAYWLKAEGDKVSGNITSIFDWDYAPAMTPIPILLLQDFIDGKANYADIITVSQEVTSPEVMLRQSKKELGIGDEWDH